MENFNGLTPAETERLALLAEECSEVVQVIGKVLRHGYESTHPFGHETNRELLDKELGHIEYARVLMVNNNDIDTENQEAAFEEKAKTIKPYLHHQDTKGEGEKQ